MLFGILATVTAHLTSNLKEVNREGTNNYEIDKFNIYFLKDVKTQGNQIAAISDNEIEFTLGNKYTFNNNCIYLNDSMKIVENIESCRFSSGMENGKQIVYVTIKSKSGAERTIEYILNEGTNDLAYFNNETNYTHGMLLYNETPKNSDGTLTANATYIEEGNVAVIPKGFKVSDVAEEQSIENGLVIQDAKGNEFVWIPCTKEDYENAVFDTNWTSSFYTDKIWKDDQTKIGAKSIEANHGFYVARYEAGVPSDAPFYADENGEKYETREAKDTTDYIPVSKKGVQAWNFISQSNAKTVSEKMYENNEQVGSYLIDSHAWNLIITKIFKEKLGKDIMKTSTWGNYSDNTNTKYEELNVLYAIHKEENVGGGISTVASTYSKGLIPQGIAPRGKDEEIVTRIELSTGASEDFKVYNIYDMAGNMWEYTTEVGTLQDGSDITKYYSRCGGSFNHHGNNNSVASRQADNGMGSSYHGFRVVLYL